MSTACTFCQRPDAPLRLGALPGSCCASCARHLGHLLQETPVLLAPIWPALAEDDDGEPEPRVRLPDGRSVELRERTAELKRELPLQKRVELAELLGELGLLREQALEAGFVLGSDAAPELLQRAVDVLFAPERSAPDTLELLRRHLQPS